MIELRDNKIFVLTNDTTREKIISHMKKEGIGVKCFPVSSILKKGGVVGPGLDIRYVTTESKNTSVFTGKSKEHANKLLELRSNEDCERINRELES